MLFGYWISFFDETYLFLLVCSGLNLRYNFEWKKGGDVANSLIALFFSVLLAIYPIFVSLFYRSKNNQDRLIKGDKDFNERFGSIVKGLNFK